MPLAEQFRRRFAKPSRRVGSATPARDSNLVDGLKSRVDGRKTLVLLTSPAHVLTSRSAALLLAIPPMRLHILSDLHLEFGTTKIPDTNADVVVLAGDIHLGREGRMWAQQQFAGKPVV